MVNHKFFELVKVLLSAYPLRTFILVFLQLMAGLADGVTMTALIPLLMIITGEISSVGQSFIIDKIINLMNFFQIDSSVTSALLIIISFTLLKTILMLITARQVGYTSAHVAKDLRLKLIKSLLNTSWSHITKTKTGNLANAIIFETEVSSDSYVKLSRLIPNIIQVVIYLILSFFLSFYVTIGGVIWAGFSAFSLRWLITISRRAGEDQVNLMKSISAKLVDVFQAFKPLKAMSKEDRFSPILEQETIELETVQRKKVFSKESLIYLQELIIVISLSSGLYYFLVYQKTTLAPIMMLIILFHRTLQRVGRLQQAYQMIREGESAFWSVYNRIKENEINSEVNHGKSIAKFDNEIRLSNVTFSYNKEELISDVNISIPKGKFVSLSGPSGSGKTTLVDIIIGLYQPKKGEILIDGVPLNTINQKSWRDIIGYVPQETVLINDTVYQNISLGDNRITKEQVINAIKSSGCEEFIDLTNNGLDQEIYEKGQNLSGGQRQRISIARAIVNIPKLLILDEATTALDPKTESSIINTLNDLKGDMTIIAISHQPQINTAAEKKYLIKNNYVIEK